MNYFINPKYTILQNKNIFTHIEINLFTAFCALHS